MRTSPQPPDSAVKSKPSWIRQTLISFAIAGGVFLLMGVSFAVGLGLGERNQYSAQYWRERQLVEPVLTSDPAFSEIRIKEQSNGGIYLSGAVRSEADLARLRKEISRLVGEPRAEEIMSGVQVFH
jgi:hypothetical protein